MRLCVIQVFVQFLLEFFEDAVIYFGIVVFLSRSFVGTLMLIWKKSVRA